MVRKAKHKMRQSTYERSKKAQRFDLYDVGEVVVNLAKNTIYERLGVYPRCSSVAIDSEQMVVMCELPRRRAEIWGFHEEEFAEEFSEEYDEVVGFLNIPDIREEDEDEE